MMSEELPPASEEEIRQLIYDCINAHSYEILVNVIIHLKKDYEELAKLATMGYYNGGQTHKEVMDYVTYET